MKGKILVFIIGLLIGAIIGVGGMYIYEQNTKSNMPSQDFNHGQMQAPNGDTNMTPPNMQEGGQSGQSNPGNGEEPPAKPDGDQNMVAPNNDNMQKPENTVENNTVNS